jgi:hypothetical protein
MPRWQARRIRHPSSSQENRRFSAAEAATALVPKLKHGTDDIWYIKYFYSIVESENRVKWYQTDAYANEDAKTLTTSWYALRKFAIRLL